MFKVPEQARIKNHINLGSDSSFGNNGFFILQSATRRVKLCCIASDGLGWEHVSIHADDGRKEYIPTWEEMCQIKDTFWGPEDVVIQYHPARSQYVNNHSCTLHLWRRVGMDFIAPPKELVGLKS